MSPSLSAPDLSDERARHPESSGETLLALRGCTNRSDICFNEDCAAILCAVQAHLRVDLLPMPSGATHGSGAGGVEDVFSVRAPVEVRRVHASGVVAPMAREQRRLKNAGRDHQRESVRESLAAFNPDSRIAPVGHAAEPAPAAVGPFHLRPEAVGVLRSPFAEVGHGE